MTAGTAPPRGSATRLDHNERTKPMATLTPKQREARDQLRLMLAMRRYALLRAGLVAQLMAMGYDDQPRAERSVDRALAAWRDVQGVTK